MSKSIDKKTEIKVCLPQSLSNRLDELLDFYDLTDEPLWVGLTPTHGRSEFLFHIVQTYCHNNWSAIDDETFDGSLTAKCFTIRLTKLQKLKWNGWIKDELASNSSQLLRRALVRYFEWLDYRRACQLDLWHNIQNLGTQENIEGIRCLKQLVI